MLKATFLTCAIIAAQPLIEGARAGDAVPAPSSSLPMIWTGRFIDIAKAPVLGSAVASGQAKHSRRADTNSDSDIVGSIPPNPADDAGRDIALLRSAQDLALCALPGLAMDSAGDDLACGGARHNRWSAKAETFNYDLSSVSPDFVNAPAPYADTWDRMISTRQSNPAP